MEHIKPITTPERKKRRLFVPALTASVALSSCVAIDSYLTDTTDVQCDGRRTISDLSGDGNAIFVVHGKDPGDQAVITVNRQDDMIRVIAENDTSASQKEPKGEETFTDPVPLGDGPEAFIAAGGGIWTLDARVDTVVIKGTCDGI